MDSILAFLFEHWLLSGAFLVVLGLILLNEWRYRAHGLKMLSSQQLVTYMNHNGGAVIDIRATERYKEGHILGAINIPTEDFAKRLSTLNKFKNKPLILVCDTGIDSPKMGKLLTENGFSQLYYLAGGMATWRSDGMPVGKKQTNLNH